MISVLPETGGGFQGYSSQLCVMLIYLALVPCNYQCVCVCVAQVSLDMVVFHKFLLGTHVAQVTLDIAVRFSSFSWYRCGA